MVTRTEYLKGMLKQAQQSYQTIKDLKDKPGDLVTMRQDLLRIRGILQVVANKIKPGDFPNSDISGLVSRSRQFLDNYYFEREMDIMEPLYGDDPGRLRHLRFKMLEALEDKGLIEKIREVSSDL